jgi:transposase-like protein
MEYSDTVKARMVRRMVGPNAVTATALAAETGIAQPTLSRWLRSAASIQAVDPKQPPPSPSNPSSVPEKRPQDWTALERAQAVLEASKLSDVERGEFLRRHGLHQEHLDQWRRALEEALTAPKRGRARSSESKRVKELERELARKDKALAEAAALLVLKKKLAALWGDEDDDTNDRSEK